MAPSTIRISDSGAPAAAAPEESKNGFLNLVDCVNKNAFAPAVNGFAVEPLNAGVTGINGISQGGTWLVNKAFGTDYKAPEAGKLPELEVGKAEPGSAAAYSQQIFGTGASFLTYAVAGKLTGKAFRGVSGLVPLELELQGMKVGHTLRSLAQDPKLSMIAGATAYAGLKDPKEGESRLSNAVSTFVGFSAFEMGNAHLVNMRSGFIEKFAERYTVGSMGGAAQIQVASLIQQHKFADKDTVAAGALSGGLLNALMPVGKQVVDAVSAPHVNEVAARLHAQAPRDVAPTPGTWSHPETVALVKEAALAHPNTKMRVIESGSTRINQSENTIYQLRQDSPLLGVQELGHRGAFIDPKFEAKFKSHADEIHSKDPADPLNAQVRKNYVDTRVEQEIAARTAQNDAAQKLGVTDRASVDQNVIRNVEGYERKFQSEADEFIKSGGEKRPEIDHAKNAGKAGDGRGKPKAVETIEELLDWPEVADRAKHSGQGFDSAWSYDYPEGRKYHWYEWPDGAHVNGHDNVIRLQHYNNATDDILLVKNIPGSKEVSVVRLSNANDIHEALDTSNNQLGVTSVEKIYDNPPRHIATNALFESEVLPRAIKYRVADGSDLVPSDTIYTVYPEHKVMTTMGQTLIQRGEYNINGVKINPLASVEYPDGRIDWHVVFPDEQIIREWPKPVVRDGVRFQVEVPQTLTNSSRRYRLNKDGTPGGIVDSFDPATPLKTDFGDAIRVVRLGDSTVYTMTDGSQQALAHYGGKLTRVRAVNGEYTNDVTNFTGKDGYTEIYPEPWRTKFGKADSVHISPDLATYQMTDGRVVEHYLKPRTIDNIENVDIVQTYPDGNRVFYLRDTAGSQIYVPPGGLDTFVTGEPRAIGLQIIGNRGGFNRYFLEDGAKMDVPFDSPGQGTIREPGRVIEVFEDENDEWKHLTTVFREDEPPLVVLQDAYGRYDQEMPWSECLAAQGNGKPDQLLDIRPRYFPGGLLTKWGLAKESHTDWTGRTHLKIDNGPYDKKIVELDPAGNEIIRDKSGKIIETRPEPADYPVLDEMQIYLGLR